MSDALDETEVDNPDVWRLWDNSDHHADRREFQVMTCAMCGRDKPWNDGFPNHAYAQCWKCWADDHMRTEHPPPKQRLRLRKPWHRPDVSAALAAGSKTPSAPLLTPDEETPVEP